MIVGKQFSVISSPVVFKQSCIYSGLFYKEISLMLFKYIQSDLCCA